MTSFHVKSFSLRRPDNANPFLRVPEEGLSFPGPGIYTVEGPNQSGKSTFLKALVGALPGALEADGDIRVRIDDSEWVKIRSPSHGNQLGIVGVFQDDHLIPSLTVIDQLILRHGRLSLRQFLGYVWQGISDFFVHQILAVLRLLDRGGPKWLMSRLAPKQVDWLQTSVIASKATSFLSSIGQDPKEILPMSPARLSGGKKALAKILAAEIHFSHGRSPRILLLDEAFSGLQRDLWPPLLERYRRWARDSDGVIIAVTHNPLEIDLWQPNRRLRIENGQLTGSPMSVSALQPGIPRPIDAFPLVRLDRTRPTEQLQRLISDIISEDSMAAIFVSPHCEGLSAFRELVAIVGLASKHDPLVISLSGAETSTNLADLVPVLESAVIHLRSDNGIILIVGGGSTLNVGSFLASILFRGVCNTVYMPTTLLAVADVAIGSKTSIALVGKGDSVPEPLNIKHSIGSYHNPCLAVVDPRYIDTLTVSEAIVGFAEVVKHGLLQSESLLNRSLSFVISQLAPHNLNSELSTVISDRQKDEAISLCEEASKLKAKVLAIDPFEQKYGKILLFGHLHAHCIERATMFVVPHGVAVYLGMLMDLRICESLALYKRILPVLMGSRGRWVGPLKDIDRDVLRRIYLTQNKSVHGRGTTFHILKITRPGQFSLQEISRVARKLRMPYEIDLKGSASEYVKRREKTVSFDTVWATFHALLEDLHVS